MDFFPEISAFPVINVFFNAEIAEVRRGGRKISGT